MDIQLVPYDPSRGLVPIAEIEAADYVLQFLATNDNPHTRRAYARDVAVFAAWKGVEPEIAAMYLYRLPMAMFTAELIRYRTRLAEEVRARRMSLSTAQHHLTGLRSLVKWGRATGKTTNTVEIKGFPVNAYKDTTAHPASITKRLIKFVKGNDAMALRDRMILWLLGGLGLRRFEVCDLNIEHVDLERGVVWVQNKGELERFPITMPRQVKAAIVSWLEIHPLAADPTAPLVVNLDRIPHRDLDPESGEPLYDPLTGKVLTHSVYLERLHGDGLYKIVKRRGAAIGEAQTRPHRIRSGAISDVARKTKDLEAVRAFSRHKKLDTVAIYLRQVEDLAGKTAQIAADSLDDTDEIARLVADAEPGASATAGTAR